MLDLDRRIYVAGHTGLIGSAFYRVLKQRGFRNLITRTHPELELTDSMAVERFFAEARPEYVILSAGKVGGIQQNQETPATFIDTNMSIQLNVLKAAHHHGVEKLIFFGSSCMYPRECPQPMDETLLLTGHPEPSSLAYAMSKLAGVQLCHAYNQQYKTKRFLPVIPNSAYGPWDNFDPGKGHVLSALIARMHQAKKEGRESVTLWGTGSAKREFIHAEDIASACLHLLALPEMTVTLPVNIGSGSEYSIRELAELIAEVVGYQGELQWDTTKPDGAPRKLLNSARLLESGWSPSISFKEGLASTYDWYRTVGAG